MKIIDQTPLGIKPIKVSDATNNSVHAIIASAPKKPAKTIKEFHVRPGSLAVCERIIGDPVAARLCHAFLELRVDTTKLINRKRDGKVHGWLFLSSEELVTLSGLSRKQIYDRAIPTLKKTSYFIIYTGRVRTNDTNKYQIAFDHNAFWFEVAAILDPTVKIKHKEGDKVFVEDVVDRKQLPYIFKRLFDLAANEPKFPN
ncbi:hypothetical protein [Pseudorhizobium marinum]|uniref:hypothetical protein n=1 Tax=Pseudorhizobium marinum TaxID=1496690 RepID=UPI000495118E|nr:hypothetical protein [Pseudorhizobium marinum]